MSDIFREVDEALQREKAAKLWKEYGPTLILAAILMVATTGITTAYMGWSSSRNQTQTGKLVIAAEQKDIAAAMEQAAEDTSGGHKTLALMNAASKYADKKDFAKAAELYQDVSKDKSAPAELRDIASVFYVRSALLAAGDTTPDYEALAQSVLPVANNSKSAFQLQAKLEAASLYGTGLKDYTKALELLSGFDASSSADSLNEKAAALKHVYEYELSGAQSSSVQE